MDILIIGGTKFLGPHIVSAARSRGHALTLFNRGNIAPPPGVVSIVGDRNTDAGVLAADTWDAVIDTCGFVPRVVRLTLDAVAARTRHYTFVSSISAYAEPLGGRFDEEETLGTMPDPTQEAITPETYGPLKALCEREVLAALPERALVVRPGLISGPLDPTDRFTYWPHRIAQAGDVLVPGTPDKPISVIDVRDLAEWIVLSAERTTAGTFNASGEYGRWAMGDVINASLAAAGGSAHPVWVDESFLVAHGVTPWTELPLWIPGDEDTILRATSAKAVAGGLKRRDLSDTVRATLDWTKQRGLDRKLNAGLTRQREAELLAAWRKHRS